MPKRSIPKGGTRGTVYRAAARERILDAEKLNEANRVHGAIYLAGYAIECHLKYAVCENAESTYLDSSLEIHSWDALLLHSGLEAKLARNAAMKSIYDELTDVWTTSLRYNPERRVRPDDLQLYLQLKFLYEFFQETAP
jgi:hypothetical protein